MVTALSLLTACGGNPKTTAEAEKIDYTVEQFADLQILRYRVPGFEDLSLKQKELVYYLTEAALQGRDILFDQNGKYNLTIRRMLEAVYTGYKEIRILLISRLWKCTSSGYGSLTAFIITMAAKSSFRDLLPNSSGRLYRVWMQLRCRLPKDRLWNNCARKCSPVIFDPTVMPKRVNQAAGEDLVLTSACNYYDGVTQQEAEDFYNALKNPGMKLPFPMV